MFNPFLLEKWSGNPFKSNQRLYPVDFGVPLERTSVFNLEYPAGFRIENVPERIGLTLPNEGGRFLFDARNVGNRVSITQSLAITKTVYSSAEYYYLKELFSQILQLQNGELIFTRQQRGSGGG